MVKIKTSTDQLITQIIDSIENSKGLEIKLLDLRKIENAFCEYFIICSGTSNTHVETIAATIEREVKKNLKDKPWHTEGTQMSEWILLDYVNVVVHVFQKQTRTHYDLEGLWGDAKFTNFTEN